MHANYLAAINKLSLTLSEINRLCDTAPSEAHTFEDKRAIVIFENLISEMQTAESRLKRLSYPAIEGILCECANGKYELIRKDTGKPHEWPFSCGNYLEVYDTEFNEWHAGRVEHLTREGIAGYYFYCNELNHPFLYNGMKARIRIEP